MGIFEYNQDELLGTVESVDTSTAIIKVENDDKLRGLQVNHLVTIQSSKVGQHLIGLVSKIIRKSGFTDSAEDLTPDLSFNVIKVVLIGTHLDKEGLKENVFRRSLATVPTINAECYLINGERLKQFMQAVSSVPEGQDQICLQIGKYSIDEDASLLPSRIRIAPPKLKPRSATIDFWDEWAKETSAVNIRNAIEALRKQSK